MASSIAFIDHYDSFSFNVIDWLVGVRNNVAIKHINYDDLDSIENLRRSPLPIVLSPGPHSPAAYPSTKRLVADLMGRVPMFGICLGHQIIAEVLGAGIERCGNPLHGQPRTIQVVSEGRLLRGMPASFRAMSYNSLTVAPESAKAAGLKITGICDQGEMQSMEYDSGGRFKTFGVQFHPESFKSEYQDILLQNWLDEIKVLQ
ncbi:MAG: aminodeoxychorismate/anthranilate synthase component II [Oligoflexales bacterium]